VPKPVKEERIKRIANENQQSTGRKTV